MKKETKMWSVGKGYWVVHTQDEKLYMKIRDTLKLQRQRKWSPAVYMKKGVDKSLVYWVLGIIFVVSYI